MIQTLDPWVDFKALKVNQERGNLKFVTYFVNFLNVEINIYFIQLNFILLSGNKKRSSQIQSQSYIYLSHKLKKRWFADTCRPAQNRTSETHCTMEKLRVSQWNRGTGWLCLRTDLTTSRSFLECSAYCSNLLALATSPTALKWFLVSMHFYSQHSNYHSKSDMSESGHAIFVLY